MVAVSEPTNPNGNMGIGAAILDEKGNSVWEYSFAVMKGEHGFNQTSNNVAEYLAMIKLLGYFKAKEISVKDATFYADSQLVINQMLGNWNMNGGIYVKYAHMAFSLRDELEKRDNCKIKFEWISRVHNNRADELSKTCLKEKGVKFRIQP